MIIKLSALLGMTKETRRQVKSVCHRKKNTLEMYLKNADNTLSTRTVKNYAFHQWQKKESIVAILNPRNSEMNYQKKIDTANGKKKKNIHNELCSPKTDDF